MPWGTGVVFGAGSRANLAQTLTMHNLISMQDELRALHQRVSVLRRRSVEVGLTDGERGGLGVLLTRVEVLERLEAEQACGYRPLALEPV